MNNKLTSPTLWLAILGALKLVLDAAGIQLPGDKLDSIANGIAATIAVVGVIIDHGYRNVVPVASVVPITSESETQTS